MKKKKELWQKFSVINHQARSDTFNNFLQCVCVCVCLYARRHCHYSTAHTHYGHLIIIINVSIYG